MDILSIILIAIGLSMDSFAVSVSNGLTIIDLDRRKKIVIAFSLAIFQALMPFIGWISGVGIEKHIKQYDHWIAFLLLSFIGGKMVLEGLQNSEKIKSKKLNYITLIGQSIATSIDAFAVGISFAFLNIPIVTPVLIIGLVTFCFAIVGLQIGKYIGSKFSKRIELLGGILLIAIGTKILIEHLFFQ